MEKVKEKRHAFFRKKHANIRGSFSKCSEKLSVIYDNTTGQHRFARNLIRASFTRRVHCLYKSRRNVGSLLCSKRKVIKLLEAQREGEQ